MQSTPHLLMVEPNNFIANPQTMETNPYQSKDTENHLSDKAIAQFRSFRDRLVEAGLGVTTIKSLPNTPDAVFPNNWVSTHADGTLVTYPMLTPNRGAERRPEMIMSFKKAYKNHINLAFKEKEGLILEGTGSLVLDRIHRIAYAIESPRTSKVLVELWCEKMGYTPVVFNAYDKNGIAEYHTNVNLFIGSKIAGVCLDKIPENQRQRVLESLSKHHEVLLLTEEQITHYCGNALEVCLPDRAHALVLSHDAFSHLTEMQKNTLSKYYKAFITPDLSVIEKYGGGSARCMLLELF